MTRLVGIYHLVGALAEDAAVRRGQAPWQSWDWSRAPATYRPAILRSMKNRWRWLRPEFFSDDRALRSVHLHRS